MGTDTLVEDIYNLLSTKETSNEIDVENNIEVFEKNYSLVDVYSAQEAFITGTLGSLTQVITIDDREIGNKNNGWPISDKLRTLYKELING